MGVCRTVGFDQERAIVVACCLALSLGVGCRNRGAEVATVPPAASAPSSPSAPPAADGGADVGASRAGDAAGVADGAAAAPAADEPPPIDAGPMALVGRVVPLEQGQGNRLLVYRAGKKRPIWSGQVDGRGRFVTSDLKRGEYRLIMPGDGLHSTADVYGKVPRSDQELVIHRSAGCPVRITVVDQGGSPVVGARLALVLPDLNHVPPEERARVEGVTNDEGQAHFVGTCVRGPIRGTIEAGSREPFEFVHGYLGNGRDRFQVELPAQGNDGA